jgi:hypothetical protein
LNLKKLVYFTHNVNGWISKQEPDMRYLTAAG